MLEVIEAALQALGGILALAVSGHSCIPFLGQLHGGLGALDALAQQLVVGLIPLAQLLQQPVVLTQHLLICKMDAVDLSNPRLTVCLDQATQPHQQLNRSAPPSIHRLA